MTLEDVQREGPLEFRGAQVHEFVALVEEQHQTMPFQSERARSAIAIKGSLSIAKQRMWQFVFPDGRQTAPFALPGLEQR